MDKFVQVGNIFYNPKFIKYIQCFNKECKIVIANTENSGLCSDSVFTYKEGTTKYNHLNKVCEYHTNK